VPGKYGLSQPLFGQEFLPGIMFLPGPITSTYIQYADSPEIVPIAEDFNRAHLPIEFLKNFTYRYSRNKCHRGQPPGPMAPPASYHFRRDHLRLLVVKPPLGRLPAWDFLRMLGSWLEKEHRVRAATSRSPNPASAQHIQPAFRTDILQILGSNRPIFAGFPAKKRTSTVRGKGKEDPLWRNSNFGAF